jgi:hypothetical protein
MQAWALPADDDTDHYRVLYQSMLPVPMRVQEHIAQWTNEEAGTARTCTRSRPTSGRKKAIYGLSICSSKEFTNSTRP